MNTVILTSVLSAGNHALFAGTRVLYGLAVTQPPQAPSIFARTSRNGVPLFALAATSSISILCFGSSFIGSGALWSWLQNIVGVSNQVCPRSPPKYFCQRLMRARPRSRGSPSGLRAGGSGVPGSARAVLSVN